MNTRSRLRSTFAAALLLGPAAVLLAAAAQPPTETAPRPASTANQSPFNDQLAALSADEKRYFQINTALADPFFEGRAPGSRGNELAAEYVEFAFKRLNLKPAFPRTDKAADGTEVATPWSSFRQSFPAGSQTVAAVQEASILTTAGPYGKLAAGPALEAGRDFNVLAMSGTAEATGPVVFAGYAIESGPGDYKTFAEGDSLEGKIALVFTYEPMTDGGKSRFAETGWSSAASPNAKLTALAKRNPAGVILVNPPGVADENAERLADVRSIRGSGTQKFPVVMMTREKAEVIAAASGASLAGLRRSADERGGLRYLSTSHVRLKGEIARKPILADNVGAVLAGRGALADEYVVVGAHVDHVGYGAFGSRAGRRGAGRLHPGADDNASGTAGLILAAEKLAAAYAAMPKEAAARSVLFVAFNAEESGLVGSRYFVRKSPISASKTYAMINMDMIGRVRYDKIDLYGVGTAEGLEDLLAPVLARSGMNVRTKNADGRLFGGGGPSDHASFAAAGVPAMHLFSGMSPEYHMPEDFYWTINPVGAVKAVNLLVDIAMTLTIRTEPLLFVAAKGPSIMFDDPSTSPPQKPAPLPDLMKPAPTAKADPHAAGGVPPAAPAGHGDPGAMAGGDAGGDQPAPAPVRVKFGIMPGDYSDEKPGVLVGDITPGTPAEKAGLKAGDRIISWNGKKLGSVESWMPYLRAAKPGDVVTLEVERGGKMQTMTCTLVGREPTATP